jgi:hypothetical protein
LHLGLSAWRGASSATEGIAIAAEDARALLYDLFDCLGLDKEAARPE